MTGPSRLRPAPLCPEARRWAQTRRCYDWLHKPEWGLATQKKLKTHVTASVDTEEKVDSHHGFRPHLPRVKEVDGGPDSTPDKPIPNYSCPIAPSPFLPPADLF